MAVLVGIIGYRGFVGSAFYSLFSQDNNYSVDGIGRENYENARGQAFDILINCNGNSSKRMADAEPEKDWEMNVKFTERFLSDFPSRHYLHISTVEVYNDRSDSEKCSEDSAIYPSLLSNYGKSKHGGEQAARRHPSFLILRLAGMVGPGMSKGPAYDILALHKLFISEKSRLHFMHTREVARIAKLLAEKGRWGETYNVVGKGNILLSEFAEIAGVKLSSAGKEEMQFAVPTAKLEKETAIPSSTETVRSFISEFGRGAQ